MGYKWSAMRNYCVTILSHTIENTTNYRNASGKLTFENTMVFLLSLPRENKVRKGIPVTHQLSNLMLFLEPRRYKIKFKIFYVDKRYIPFSPCQLWPNTRDSFSYLIFSLYSSLTVLVLLPSNEKSYHVDELEILLTVGSCWFQNRTYAKVIPCYILMNL